MARKKPKLTQALVLKWADAHHRRTGRWPSNKSGQVLDAPDENWMAIDKAFVGGCRGQRGGSSLAKLLIAHHRKQDPLAPPRLTIRGILRWADAHHQRTGGWPTIRSGSIAESPEDTWLLVAQAISNGQRGLACGTTLPQVLAKYRNVRHRRGLPRLTVKQILKWADAHRSRNGRWPLGKTSPIPGTSGETWLTVQTALSLGGRGLAGGMTLAKLLAKHRGKPLPTERSRLTVRKILAWADAHHRRTGGWPKDHSRWVHGAPGEHWLRIDAALEAGFRGLPTGSSLPRLLAKHRGVRNVHGLPRLTIKQLLVWVDAHKKRTGRWPNWKSGRIANSPGDTWATVQNALFLGSRGMRNGNTLAQVLAKHRGVRNHMGLAALRIPQILKWADAHHRRTGRWPKLTNGRIPECRGQTWLGIDSALYEGLRGLRGGTSLPRLLAKHRGVRNVHDLPRLAIKQILEWADRYYKREKSWPNRNSGPILRSGGESWGSINAALLRGRRGRPAGGSLAKFLNKHRRPERGL